MKSIIILIVLSFNVAYSQSKKELRQSLYDVTMKYTNLKAKSDSIELVNKRMINEIADLKVRLKEEIYRKEKIISDNKIVGYGEGLNSTPTNTDTYSGAKSSYNKTNYNTYSSGCTTTQCTSYTKKGNRCLRRTTNCSGRCWQH